MHEGHESHLKPSLRLPTVRLASDQIFLAAIALVPVVRRHPPKPSSPRKRLQTPDEIASRKRSQRSRLLILPSGRRIHDEEGGRAAGVKMRQKLAIVLVHRRHVHLHERHVFEMSPHAGVRKDLTVDTVAHLAPVRPYVDEGKAMCPPQRRQRISIGDDISHHVGWSSLRRKHQQSNRRSQPAQKKRSPRQSCACTCFRRIWRKRLMSRF